ncbi:MAG TPA: hypothetical protein VFN48_01575 [Solirubrobacteraceae bacterium]|nr:hypothetical protein [Solirubrobacteraceae bacterium]
MRKLLLLGGLLAALAVPTFVGSALSHNTFTRAGVYHLYCQVHPTMMMQTIIVH